MAFGDFTKAAIQSIEDRIDYRVTKPTGRRDKGVEEARVHARVIARVYPRTFMPGSPRTRGSGGCSLAPMIFPASW